MQKIPTVFFLRSLRRTASTGTSRILSMQFYKIGKLKDDRILQCKIGRLPGWRKDNTCQYSVLFDIVSPIFLNKQNSFSREERKRIAHGLQLQADNVYNRMDNNTSFQTVIFSLCITYTFCNAAFLSFWKKRRALFIFESETALHHERLQRRLLYQL